MSCPEISLGRDREDAVPRSYEVTGGGTGRSGEVRLALKGIDSRDAAMALRGLPWIQSR